MKTQRAAIIMDHITVHVTRVTLAMALSALTSTSAKKVTTIVIPMPNAQILSVEFNVLVEMVLKVMEPCALILMNVPTDSTTVTIIVIATIQLAHSLVAVKTDSLARAVSARISMNAKKVWTTVTRMPAARTKKADLNANVSQVSLEMVSIAMIQSLLQLF